MQAFVWNARYETGITAVDEQHRQLVEIVNALGEALINGRATERSLVATFNQLADYAQFHFAEEETLMQQAHMLELQTSLHQQHHRHQQAARRGVVGRGGPGDDMLSSQVP